MASPSWQDYVAPLFGGAGFLGASALDKSNNNGILGSVGNSLEGDPNSLVAALQGLMKTAYARGDQTKNFLMGREKNAEQYYRPMQQMFGNMYGTGGMMPPKAPGGY